MPHYSEKLMRLDIEEREGERESKAITISGSRIKNEQTCVLIHGSDQHPVIEGMFEGKVLDRKPGNFTIY